MNDKSDLELTIQDTPFSEEIFNEIFCGHQPLSTEADNHAGADNIYSILEPPKTDCIHGSALNANAEKDICAPSSSLPWKSAAAFVNFDFSKKVEEYKNKKRYDIGFPSMGNHGVLLPSFLVLGAESSLGKTTFLTQIADQLSAAGKKVLIFSLEQSTFEIVSKGLSRTMALKAVQEQGDPFKIPSAEELRFGKATVPHEIQTIYQERANNIFIVDKVDNSKVGAVINAIDRFCEMYPDDEPPVVMIDYFQILSTDTGGEKNKAAFDAILDELHACQKKNDLLMMVISSINRSHYGEAVSFASFKETGNLEYSADIIWGLQFSIVKSEQYRSAKASKQEIIDNSRNENPRKIELTVLKSRGSDLSSFPFIYYPNCDLFLEAPKKASGEEETECPSEMDNGCEEEELGPE